MRCRLTSIVLLASLCALAAASSYHPVIERTLSWLSSSFSPLGTMNATKLVPNDSRVRKASAVLRGKTYEYIVGEPERQPPIDTIVLIHGFPDLGFGWRYQVPHLMAQGYRVVVPDMIGYAGTDSPEDLRSWSFKSIAADIKELSAKFVGDDGQIILGGHDWGGALVWRVALWHPELIKAVFSICTPFAPGSSQFTDLKDIIAAGKLLNFRYQLQLRGPEVEEKIRGEKQVRLFLNGMHGGIGPNGELPFSADGAGVLLDNLHKLEKSRAMTGEELDFYVEQYMRQKDPQLRGPLNWYRTDKINWEEERELAGKSMSLQMPTLYIGATHDVALPPALSVGMERFMPHLTRGEVSSSHWALTEASADVNKQLGKWLEGLQGGNARPAL